MIPLELSLSKPMQYFIKNPFFIFDLPANATRSEIKEKFEKITRYAKLEALNEYDYTFKIDGYNHDLDFGALQSYFQKLNDEIYRVFWLTNPSELFKFSDWNNDIVFFREDYYKYYDRFIVFYFITLNRMMTKGDTEGLYKLIYLLDYTFTNKPKEFKEIINIRYQSVDKDNRGNISNMAELTLKSLLLPLYEYIDESTDSPTLIKIYFECIECASKELKDFSNGVIKRIEVLLSKRVMDLNIRAVKYLDDTKTDWTSMMSFAHEYTVLGKLVNPLFDKRVVNPQVSYLAIRDNCASFYLNSMYVNAYIGHFDELYLCISRFDSFDSQLRLERTGDIDYCKSVYRGSRYLANKQFVFSDFEKKLVVHNHLLYVKLVKALDSDSDMQMNIAHRYFEEVDYLADLEDLKPSNEAGLRWLKQAAKESSAAQFELYYRYYWGKRVEMDDGIAFYWLKLAAKNGNEEAKELWEV